MTQRFGDLGDWKSLKGDGSSGVQFPGELRTVTLDVSSTGPVQLFVSYQPAPLEDGTVPPEVESFLALVTGRDKVEFTVGAEFTLWCEGGDIIYRTDDGELTHNVDIAPVIFTRIANRKARNPHMEMMEYKMQLNLQRRMEQMEKDALMRLDDKVNLYAKQRNTLAPTVAARLKSAVGGETGEASELGADGAGEAPKDEGKATSDKPAKAKAAAPSND